MSENTFKYETCFCCGKDNKNGLKIDFKYPQDGEAQAELIIPKYCSGWEDITHGGFLSMFLDETMAHACVSLGVHAFTAKMDVKFIKPVKVGSKIELTGKIIEKKTRTITTQASILDSNKEKIAESSGLFIIPRKEPG